MATKEICILCHSVVNDIDEPLECGSCAGLAHRKCSTNMASEEFRSLFDNNGCFQWKCPECHDDVTITDQDEEDDLVSVCGSSPLLNASEESTLHHSTSNKDPSFHIVNCGRSKRGGKKLFDATGYSYTVKRVTSCGTTWRCTLRRKGCHCPAFVKQAGQVFTEVGVHIHEPNVGEESANAAGIKMEKDALLDLFKPTALTVHEEEEVYEHVEEDVPSILRCSLLPAAEREADSNNSVNMDFNNRLIDQVCPREILYNQYHDMHKDKLTLMEEWKNVAAALKSTAEACRRRWNTLRTKYGKERKKIKMSTGSKASRGSSWPHYEKLAFLNPFITHRNRSADFFSGDQVVEDVEEGNGIREESDRVSESPSSSVITPPVYVHRKRKITEKPNAEREEIKVLKLSTGDERKDKFDHFADFIAAHLRGKKEKEADFYIKAVTDALFTPITVEVMETSVE